MDGSTINLKWELKFIFQELCCRNSFGTNCLNVRWLGVLSERNLHFSEEIRLWWIAEGIRRHITNNRTVYGRLCD